MLMRNSRIARRYRRRVRHRYCARPRPRSGSEFSDGEGSREPIDARYHICARAPAIGPHGRGTDAHPNRRVVTGRYSVNLDLESAAGIPRAQKSLFCCASILSRSSLLTKSDLYTSELAARSFTA